jgi:hypothetical protein
MGIARTSFNLAKQMDCVITIRSNLCLDLIFTVAGRDRLTLPFDAIRGVLNDVGNDPQTSTVAKAGKDKRGIPTYVPILATEQVFEIVEESRFVECNNSLTDLKLIEKDLGSSELFNKLGSSPVILSRSY